VRTSTSSNSAQPEWRETLPNIRLAMLLCVLLAFCALTSRAPAQQKSRLKEAAEAAGFSYNLDPTLVTYTGEMVHFEMKLPDGVRFFWAYERHPKLGEHFAITVADRSKRLHDGCRAIFLIDNRRVVVVLAQANERDQFSNFVPSSLLDDLANAKSVSCTVGDIVIDFTPDQQRRIGKLKEIAATPD
jgi:hypothetical protein